MRVGAGVGEAINQAGRVRGVPKTLVVRRLYHGRLIPIQFDPASEDILGLTLLPGDEISY